ncbi:MAG: hypothetical protein ACI8W8_001241 [Rhodothermales bacterium]|jgi:hypothetical protein
MSAPQAMDRNALLARYEHYRQYILNVGSEHILQTSDGPV